MTFSIIARCPRTGRFGVGSTTYSVACGRRNESVRPNIGISKSQAFYLRHADVLALNLMAQGFGPERVGKILEATDPDFSYRQFGLLDREGTAFAFSGANINPWSGHKVGSHYAAYGNTLAGSATLDGIVNGFLRNEDLPIEYRLLEALEGGRDAGGQARDGVHLPERSAWIRVVGILDHPEIDVRVDLDDDSVAKLRRILDEFKRREEYYRNRSLQPHKAVAETEFEKTTPAL